MVRTLICVAGAAALISTLLPQCGVSIRAAPRAGFEVSFVPGSQDNAGRFMGGTEMRVLTAHQGKLYAGNGYWEDRPGREGAEGPQILVLEAPNAGWRVDHDFDARLLSGRPRYLAVSALYDFRFTTDWQGHALAEPVSMLAAAFWDLTGQTQAFTRDDRTGAWSAATLAYDRPAPNFLPQVRSFAEHRDRVTGVDLAFAGQNPRGVFSGGYDPSGPGRIRWNTTPELGVADVSAAGLSGTSAGLRVSSFAECNGRLYAAVGQQIFERSDGKTPQWRVVYTNRYPGHSETGLRGLTAIAAPSGNGEVLLVAVEGTAARIVRVEPRDGSEVTEVDLPDFLGRHWGMPASYIIAAYNDMAGVLDPAGRRALLIGLEAFIPARAAIGAGHSVVTVGYGRLEAGGWYLVRRVNGSYDLHQVAADRALVATRSILISPFPKERDVVYFAGYDANKAPAHGTAWIYKSSLTTAIGASLR